jgi:hypothetical protein
MRWPHLLAAGLLISWACFGSLFVASCSLFHQELPNEKPVLQVSQADTTRLSRGGRVALEVRASDADDDPLAYHWSAFGAGSFTDSSSALTEWIAPTEIFGNSEFFLIKVTITDRQCDLIPVAADRQKCEDEIKAIEETFLIEVVQSIPTLEVSTLDTSISFASPALVIDAFGADADGDVLTFEWEALEGRDPLLTVSAVAAGHSRARFLPLFPENHRLRIETSDGLETVRQEIPIEITAADIPEGGMVTIAVERSDGTTSSFEIDAFEYPNAKGEMPLRVENWFEAARLCEDQGKRLCRSPEWRTACRGAEGLTFSSPDDPNTLPANFGRRFCNVMGSEVAGEEPSENDLAPSGSFPNCRSSAGVYDLTGNVSEWVEDRDVFGDIVAGQALSYVQILAPCVTIANLDTILFSEDFDIRNQAHIDSLLEEITYTTYGSPGFGFRCCR